MKQTFILDAVNHFFRQDHDNPKYLNVETKSLFYSTKTK